MKRTIAAAILGTTVALSLTACNKPPGDTINEIEVVRSGDGQALSVETEDGQESVYRKGLPCNVNDRLSQCADKDDLLVEQEDARDGDRPDIEHEGEQSNDTEES